MNLTRPWSLVLIAAYFVGTLSGQTTNGSITGTISDPSGGAIAGVQIQVSSPDTGFQRTATSSETGTYVLPQLPPGTYNIQVLKAGFGTESRPGVQLLVNQSATIDFKLSLATVIANS